MPFTLALNGDVLVQFALLGLPTGSTSPVVFFAASWKCRFALRRFQRWMVDRKICGQPLLDVGSPHSGLAHPPSDLRPINRRIDLAQHFEKLLASGTKRFRFWCRFCLHKEARSLSVKLSIQSLIVASIDR